MKSKHKFSPDQVVPMEERALLSSFPTSLAPVTKLHFRGAFVLTARTYNNLQSAINTDVATFEKSVIKLLNKQGGYTTAFDTAVGDGTLGTGSSPWGYANGTLLARLDAQMGSLEFKLPGGHGSTPSIGGGLGSGLSNLTQLTSVNPASLNLGASVAELQDNVISADEAAGASAATLLSDMNAARAEALTIAAGYVKAFGPPGARQFGTANS